MALQTASMFNLTPVQEVSPLATALRGALTGYQEQQASKQAAAQAQRLEQIAANKQALKTTGAQFMRLKSLPTLREQKRELQKLGEAAAARGEDIAPFQEGLKTTNPDEMGVFLERIITRAKSMEDKFSLAEKEQANKVQFGAQETLKDDAGKLFFATSKRNPLTEQFETVLAGIGHNDQPVGALKKTTTTGLTAEEQTKKKVEEAGAISEIKVEEAGDVEKRKQREKRVSAIRTEMSTRDRDASRAQIKLNRALILANQATQGLSGDLKVKFAKIFPDIDVTDEASLAQSLRSLALDELQKFKGPTTDFEFGVAESTTGMLGDPKTANIARIKSIMRNNWFNAKETEQYNRHVKAGGDPDTFRFNFGEPVKTKKGVFTLQQLQDTAVKNNSTIDEIIEALNK